MSKAVAIGYKSFLLLQNNPKVSDMSSSFGLISLGSFQLKWYNNWEKNRFNNCKSANDMSGHILLPRPNGMNSKLDTLKSIREPWNLSGRKQSASIQYSIALLMAHALMITLVLFGISYPLISHFSLDSLLIKAPRCCLYVSSIYFIYFKFCYVDEGCSTTFTSCCPNWYWWVFIIKRITYL